MARQLFTARYGGVSKGDFDSFNLGSHVGDRLDNVEANRILLAKLVSVEKLVFMNQVHGNRVVKVADGYQPQDADALITSEKNTGLVVLVADCLPVLIDGQSVVGAIHVGRKGMTNGVVERTIAEMVAQGATNMKATIGPAICGECYEVSPEMHADIVKDFPRSNAGGNRLDLRSEVSGQLEDLGLEVNQFENCTRESDQYFSYRRNNSTGRQCGVISL
jgi:YfiH family protein